MDDAVEIQQGNGGVRIRVRVVPGASRDAVRDCAGGALRVAVSAAPEKGKANKAVEALLAKMLGLKKSAVAIIAGDTSRDKRVWIEDCTVVQVNNAVQRALATAKTKGRQS